MSEENTYVIKKRDYADIIQIGNKEAIEEFLGSPVSEIVATITGGLANGPKAWLVAGGHLAQAAFKGKLRQQFAAEIKEFQSKGKIAEDFAEKKHGFQTWIELLKV